MKRKRVGCLQFSWPPPPLHKEQSLQEQRRGCRRTPFITPKRNRRGCGFYGKCSIEGADPPTREIAQGGSKEVSLLEIIVRRLGRCEGLYPSRIHGSDTLVGDRQILSAVHVKRSL